MPAASARRTSSSSSKLSISRRPPPVDCKRPPTSWGRPAICGRWRRRRGFAAENSRRRRENSRPSLFRGYSRVPRRLHFLTTASLKDESSTMRPMRLSFLVLTYRRVTELLACLDSLERDGAREKAEVLVGLNDEPSDNEAVGALLQSRYPWIRVLPLRR